jgi:crotonobetainyl-CoA:carnitine CoA-transferase CaiB-like acyl-CoA transferase
MSESLLAGIRVVDLTGEPAQLTGRILADLGADVVHVEGPDGEPLRSVPPVGPDGESLRFSLWNAGKATVVVSGADDPQLMSLLSSADAVLTTPGWPGAIEVEPSVAPQVVWVAVTPFGLSGPRAGWRASDLGVMAASGNMYSTGDSDRPPVRCTEPSAYAHTGPEAALAVLSGLASNGPQRVDISMQETVQVANMGAGGRFARGGFRGRRSGATTGRTREIWSCADGFVSFGLRGGKARVANLQTITRLVDEAGLATPALTERDWSTYNHNEVSDDELRAIEQPIAAYFMTRTMTELYEVACQTHLMLAPANSPKELYGSAQLTERGFFDGAGRPAHFVVVRSADGLAAPARIRDPAGPAGPRPPRTGGSRSTASDAGPAPAWAGTRILEFGSGAAGPIASRYFVEHGAEVIRVESRSRPDFLRVYALGPGNPHGLEGSEMFDALNVGKRSVTLNLKHPRAVELARRLVGWADAVAENFAPRAMRGFGLDYDRLAEDKPDLVMVSACLQGQTGPHKDYPGFGGQGSALAGFNWLTGWPDREPVGPFGTITDSLAPRFVATALAAGLLYRRRTGRGVYLDVAQVEAGAYTLAPWLLDYRVNGRTLVRMGNRSPRAVPHGAFPAAGRDRWVAIAAWDDDDWSALLKVVGDIGDPGWTLADRESRIDEIESALGRWTSGREAEVVAQLLQAAGIEAVPVADFGDVYEDAQLRERQHFVTLTHPYLGESGYERNGFRLSNSPSGYSRPSPTLGQDNDYVFGEVLGLSAQQRSMMAEEGVFD